MGLVWWDVAFLGVIAALMAAAAVVMVVYGKLFDSWRTPPPKSTYARPEDRDPFFMAGKFVVHTAIGGPTILRLVYLLMLIAGAVLVASVVIDAVTAAPTG